jgi:hypothetical protein
MNYRLMSMMPDKKDWHIRNDRYRYSHEKGEQQLAQARREMMQWLGVEPNTAFKIEQQNVKTGAWEDLPRNAHGGVY